MNLRPKDWRLTWLGLGLLLGLLPGCTQAPRAAPDLILYNGKILTVDESFSITDAVAIAEGRFLAVGKSENVRELAGAGTCEVDLAGRTVVPGLWDSHNHQYSRVARDLSNASHVRPPPESPGSR